MLWTLDGFYVINRRMNEGCLTEDFLKNYALQGEMLHILTYPDPVLAKVAKPVERFDEKLKTLAENMLRTLYSYPGIGLAAPQVGEPIRMFVIDVDYERNETGQDSSKLGDVILTTMNPRVFINPIFRIKQGDTTYREGCLSVPGVYEEVHRAANIVVDYRDLENNPCTISAEGLLAICMQHENDHLEGIVFLDRVSELKRELLKKKYFKKKNQQAS